MKHNITISVGACLKSILSYTTFQHNSKSKESIEMIDDQFRPFRRTTTVTFHHCQNMTAILSPATEQEMEDIAYLFVTMVKKAGFTVMKTDRGLHKVMWHRFWHPALEWGYTIGTIVGTSDISGHGYAEPKYGSAYELETNLCYLQKEQVKKNDESIALCKKLFAEWLQPKDGEHDIEVEQSRDRYFRPTI